VHVCNRWGGWVVLKTCKYARKEALLKSYKLCSAACMQEHGGDASAGYAEMGSKGGHKGGEARKEQMAEVSGIILQWSERHTVLSPLLG